MQIGTSEGFAECVVVVAEVELSLDVINDVGCRGGGEGEDGHMGQKVSYFGNLEVCGSEVVAPL